MSRDEMLTQFLGLTPSDKIILLLLVSFNLTIVGRDVFAQPDDARKVNHARGMLEINHQITQNVVSRLRATDSRYPDDVFIDILRELFAEYKLEPYLPAVWDEATRKLR